MAASEQKLHTPGITDVPGFVAAAASADVRGLGNGRLDLALVRNLGPDYTAAAVFTRNDVKAASVRQGEDTLRRNGGRLQAVLINSGNANACTGPEGEEDNARLIQSLAAALGIPADDLLVSSTGRIGRRLPIDRMLDSLPALAKGLAPDGEAGHAASQAILTSDTRPKTVTVKFSLDGREVTIGGMAKGAGMIQPDMATMLAYFATDVQLEPGLAQRILREAVQTTFNAISVDGDMSTNDTVVLLANGRSGTAISDSDPTGIGLFREKLTAVCEAMARAIVGDGEKISHVVELVVAGAMNTAEAEKVARAIGNSLLVKSSWYGADPNWGRILDAAGYARVGLDESKLELFYNETPVFRHGREAGEYREQWRAIVREREFGIRLNLNRGDARFRLLTTDLTEAYVHFNKSE